MRNLKKAGALLLAATMVVSCFTACGGNTGSGSGNNDGGTTGDTAKYPIQTDVTVSYWMELNGNVAANFSNMGDTVLAQELQKQTGIKVEFQHPAVGQTAEQFNLLLGKTELPDVIEYNWLGFSGGPEKAIKDGVIIELNDVIDKWCPNLKAYLKANPEIDKMIKTDDGKYYCFPFIRGGDMLLTSMGPMIRKDYLDKFNLQVPKTIADWENVLTTFKNNGIEVPFTYQWSSGGLTNNNPFAYAYGVTREFFLDNNGKVVYGGVADGYKDYLKTMNKWYKAGLIDPDLITLTGDQVTSKVTSGKAGASFAYCGSGLGNWTTAGKSTNKDFLLVACPYPTVNGGKPEMGQRDNNYIGTGSAAITTSCKNVEVVAKLLDYAYSEAGATLFNFGTEGQSFTMVDGKATFTEEVTKNPKGLSMAHALSNYIRAHYNGPFVQQEAYSMQYYQTQEQKDALAIWSDTNMGKHVMPPVTSTPEESKEMSQKLTDITKYRDQQTVAFIKGTVELTDAEWDKYVKQINDLGLERVLELKEAALARYNKR